MYFFTLVFYSIYSPKISYLNNLKRFNDIKDIFIKTTKVLFLVGSVLFFLIILLGDKLIFILVSEYVKSFIVLVILSITNFLSITFSMYLPIVIMCDQQKKYLNRLFLPCVFSSISFIYFTPVFRIIGAVICVSVVILIDVSMKVYLTHNKLQIFTT